MKENRVDWLKGGTGGTCGTGAFAGAQLAYCSMRINHGAEEKCGGTCCRTLGG